MHRITEADSVRRGCGSGARRDCGRRTIRSIADFPDMRLRLAPAGPIIPGGHGGLRLHSLWIHDPLRQYLRLVRKISGDVRSAAEFHQRRPDHSLCAANPGNRVAFSAAELPDHFSALKRLDLRHRRVAGRQFAAFAAGNCNDHCNRSHRQCASSCSWSEE